MHRNLTRFLSLALVVVFSFAALPARQSAPQQTSPEDHKDLCRISGTVLSANTGEPVKKAVISIRDRDADNDDRDLYASSDAAGHFSIENIPPGQYELSVSRARYQTAYYGQSSSGTSGAVLRLATGQKLNDLVFRLRRLAVITGQVVDEDGDPITYIEVEALPVSGAGNKSKMERGYSQQTDDRGTYRIPDLIPGKYIVKAVPSRDRLGRTSALSSEYPITYYSNSTDRARAAVIAVKSGDEMTGIDFTFVPRPAGQTFTVRGQVTSTIPDASPLGFAIILFPRKPEDRGAYDGILSMRADPKTGRFEENNVAPGEYTMIAMSLNMHTRHASARYVSVIDSDVNDVSIVVTAGIDIPGKVVREGKLAIAASGLAPTLEPKELSPVFSYVSEQQASVKADGSLVFTAVSDGDYELRVPSECKECFLKSATANGVDVLGQGMEITGGAGPGPITIVYSSNSGTVTGGVINQDELPAVGATVVLVPGTVAGAPQKPENYKQAVTDQYGHFEIKGVPPGHYQAYAWETPEEEVYRDPGELKKLQGQEEAFDVDANEKKDLELKMIPAADSAN